MVTAFQIFECRRNVLHLKGRIDRWPDSEVFDHADHALKHFNGSNHDALNPQSLGEYREHIEAPAGARQQAYQADRAADGGGFDRLVDRAGAAGFDDMVHADTAGDLENSFAPLRLLLVADHMLHAQLLESRNFCFTSRDREDTSAR